MRITIALLFMLGLSTLLYMTQQASLDIASDEDLDNNNLVNMYEYENSTLQNINTIKNSNGSGYLPDSVTGDATQGGFSDLFNTFKAWVLGPVKFIWGILTAIPNALNAMETAGLPSFIADSLSWLWYGCTFFLLVMWLRWNI